MIPEGLPDDIFETALLNISVDNQNSLWASDASVREGL